MPRNQHRGRISVLCKTDMICKDFFFKSHDFSVTPFSVIETEE